jgi:hypothetical protein
MFRERSHSIRWIVLPVALDGLPPSFNIKGDYEISFVEVAINSMTACGTTSQQGTVTFWRCGFSLQLEV